MSLKDIIALMLGSSLLSSLVTFYVTRKKRKAETTGIELDNLKKQIDIFQEVHEEQKAKIEMMEDNIRELTASYNGLVRLYEAMCDNCVYRKEFHKKGQ